MNVEELGLTDEELLEFEEVYEEATALELDALVDRVTDLVYEGRKRLVAAKKREALAAAGYLQTLHPDPAEAAKGVAATAAATRDGLFLDEA